MVTLAARDSGTNLQKANAPNRARSFYLKVSDTSAIGRRGKPCSSRW